MIDIHCHILPGIDDGPVDEAGSLALARAAVDAGTTTIVATPHVSWDYPANTAASIADGVARLEEALVREGIPLELRTGGEVAMTRAAELDDDELVALRLGGPSGRYLLLECPLTPVATGFEQVCARLRARGHELVLAHPERAPAFQREPAAYARLIEQGMLGQVTAGSLVGRFGKTVRTFADRLVREGLAHDIASDAHSTDRRPPSIGPELMEAGFGERARWLAHDVPGAVLDGSPIPGPPPIAEEPARGLRRLLRGAR